MRIAIVTNFLYPETLGGTEIYCYQLSSALIKCGHEVYWFVPNFNRHDTVTSRYDNGLFIVRFAAVKGGSSPDPDFVATSFVNEIKKRDITVAHFNEFGGFEGISSNLLNKTSKAGIRTVVTLHLVHYICRTGTMRFGGTEVCNGKLIPSRCGSCKLFSNATAFSSLNHFLSSSFTPVFRAMEKNNLPVPAGMKRAINNFKDRIPFIEALRESADAIVSLTQWFKEVLIINGVPAEKIIHIPQAGPVDHRIPVSPASSREGFVFIGRINKEKGVDLLLKAAAILKREHPAIYIDLYGPIPKTSGSTESRSFMEQIKAFPNIHYKRVLAPEEVMPVIAKYKAVLLPSIVSEMAPMVIMEANKLQTPVIGSDVPGSAELINQYQSGLIFKYKDASDLAEKIIAVEKGKCNFEFAQPFENDFNGIARKYLEVYIFSSGISN